MADDHQNPEDGRFDLLVEMLADVARRQEELAAAIDRRLATIEAKLAAAATVGPSASTQSLSDEVAARRLAELRAERAWVQTRLAEERLLAAPPSVEEGADDDETAAPGDDNPIWPERDGLIWPHHGTRSARRRR